MTTQFEEKNTVGIIPDRTFCTDTTIVDYKFKFNNVEYKLDIYLAYEASNINELIKIGVFNKTNRMCYNGEIRINDLFRDPMLMKLEENSNIYKINIYFFYLLLKNAFSDKNTYNLLIELVEINTNYYNNLKITSIGFINYDYISKLIQIDEKGLDSVKQILVLKISFKSSRTLHKFQINLIN